MTTILHILTADTFRNFMGWVGIVYCIAAIAIIIIASVYLFGNRKPRDPWKDLPKSD